MSESLPKVRWVSQLRGGPIFYVVFSVPVVVAVIMVVLLGAMAIMPKNSHPEWVFYGLVGPIFLVWVVWLYLILTGADPSRPAQVEAAAQRLGLLFADRPEAGEILLPLEFSLAKISSQWLLPWRRGPRNVIRGKVGDRAVWMFDIAYPFLGYDFIGIGVGGRMEAAAAYFPDPVDGLPDWPTNGSCFAPGSGTGPPEPFASVLRAHSAWTVECRAGRLLIYRPCCLCHPDSYPEFLTAVGQVYTDLVTARSDNGGER
jgi:hypothetical protein